MVKQYVLEAPPIAAAADASPIVMATPLRRPRPWRALLLLVVVEPLALALLYVALPGDAGGAQRGAPTGPATVAAFAFAADADARAAAANGTAAAPPSPTTRHRIAFEHGKYIVDLHGADPADALALLTEATRATVHGGDVLLRAAAPLSRSTSAATPAELWQAVFGDVASFAVSCTSRRCAVWVTPVARAGGADTGATSFAPSAGAMAAPAAAAVTPPTAPVANTEDDPGPPPAATASIAARAVQPAPAGNAEGAAEN